MFTNYVSADELTPGTLAFWNFSKYDEITSPSVDVADPAKPLPDKSTTENASAFVYNEGVTNRTTLKGQNGFVFCTNWQRTEDLYWLINGINTEGFISLNFGFKISGTSSGPRDFKVQYQIGSGEWADISADTIKATTGWTNLSYALPAACENRTSINLRIIKASSIRLGNPTTAISSGGQVKLDDVLITGYEGEPGEEINLPETMALWDFRTYTNTSSADLVDDEQAPVKPTPDESNEGNAEVYVHTEGAANRITMKCQSGYIFVTEWGGGIETDKYWLVNGINTEGYESLKFNFRISNSNSGPRDFKVQYQIAEENWTDIADAVILSASSAWTSHAFDLPQACEDKAVVNLRVLRNSAYRVLPDTGQEPDQIISGGGQGRIDDIKIIGTKSSGSATGIAKQKKEDDFTFYVSKNNITINSNVEGALSIFNLSGQKIYSANINSGRNQIFLNAGIYLFQIEETVKKVVVY